MNVLTVSLDYTLAMDRDKVRGDAHDRHIKYGKYLKNLFIVVYSKKEQILTTRRLADNVMVYPTSSRNMPFFAWDAYRIGKKICREHKIDIITTQDVLWTGLVGYALKRKFYLPLNLHIIGSYLDSKAWLSESKMNHILNMTGKFLVKKADSIRVSNSLVKNYLIERLRIPSERVVNLPMFLNTSRFSNKNSEANKEKKHAQSDDIVLFVGALTKVKNVQALLMAAAEVIRKRPETRFVIVGDGPERMKLVGQSVGLGIEKNIKFEGAVAYDDMPAYYHSCSLLVLTSRHEGWPRVVIEALASEKPVIVSDSCGGASEAVTEWKCGFVFPVDRTDILAEKIIYLLESAELRQQMGELGQAQVKDAFDLEKNAYKYKELYDRTIQMARGRS